MKDKRYVNIEMVHSLLSEKKALKAKNKALLAALEGVVDMLDLCQHTGSIPERLANLDTWKARIESANAAITNAKREVPNDRPN